MQEKESKPKNMQALQKRYQTRFGNIRMAREAAKTGDLLTAMKYYNGYLKVLSDIHDVDPFQLRPDQFNPKSELSEMLMISQVYWELTKIYDNTSKLQDNFSNALNQFVLFTINHPYQVVNAEILRRHLRANPSPNLPIFKAAYDKIFIESSKCFIATYAFGEHHWVTQSLRHWKTMLNRSGHGVAFIKFYYWFSSRIVDSCEKNQINQILMTKISRPFLLCFAKLLNKFILKP